MVSALYPGNGLCMDSVIDSVGDSVVDSVEWIL